MLRTIRLTLAIVFFALITLLFLDFSGTLHGYMGWMAKIQFLPALLALNVGVVLLLVVLTLLFGRVYCSVICPLGVFQDVISWFAGKRKKNRFRYSPHENGCAMECWHCFSSPSLQAYVSMPSLRCLSHTAPTGVSLPTFLLLSINGVTTCWHTWRSGQTAMPSTKRRCG